MSTPPKWSPDAFAARLEERLREQHSVEPELTPERLEYRRAAALLTSFDPSTLRRPDDESAGAAVLYLVDDCVIKGGGRAVMWSLRPDVREAALSSFTGPADALRALEANAAAFPESGTEQIALAYLRGRPPSLKDLDVAAAGHVLQAVRWLSLVRGVAGVPAEDDIQRMLDRRRMLEPLQALLRHGFEGRTRELEQLRAFVGFLPASTWRGKVAGVGRSLSERLGREPSELPLVVYGPGGIGKSTLLARFLLSHVARDENAFPFVYVDFERATVSINQPMTLVAEMARQLAIRYPTEMDAFMGIASTCRGMGRRQRYEQEQVDELQDVATTRVVLGRDAYRRSHFEARDEDAQVIEELSRTVRRAVAWTPHDKRPFLVVLDSFEEAQYRASPVLDRMWAMFDVLTGSYPQTRVVVAGRAPVGHPSVRLEDVPTIELAEFDRDAGVAFLSARGVSQPVASAIVQRIGGNPLSLQLAAKVATAMDREGDSGEWVHKIPAKRRWLLWSVDDMLIQGILYDRLLKHIRNPDVRRLAHPGLVLRLITPEILREVLAPHCGLEVPSIQRAQELFSEMARELDLVEQIEPQILRYRPDVRRVMLRLLEKDKAAATRAVERDAITFYERSDTPRGRAEEIYHRLRMDKDLPKVESRWMPEAAIYLEGAEPELPPRSASLLSRLLLQVPAGLLDEADQISWEQSAAAEVEDLLAQGFVDQALAALDSRRPWTICSPLHSLLVEALVRAGRMEEAQSAVSRALDEPAVDRCGDTYLELLLLSAQVAAQVGNVDAADADLQQAERVATSLGRDLDALGAMLQRARLHGAIDDPDEDEASKALARRIESMPEQTLANSPTLYRAIAAEVGAREPHVLAQALDLVGLPQSSKRILRTLAIAIADALEAQPTIAEALQRLLRRLPDLWQKPQIQVIVQLLEEVRSRGMLDEFAKELLTIRDDSGNLRSGIAAAMSVDDPRSTPYENDLPKPGPRPSQAAQVTNYGKLSRAG